MVIGRPSGYYNTSYNQELAIVRTRLQWALLILAIAFLFCMPLFVGSQWLSMLNIAGITLIAVLGLNIATGYCGQLSIGQAAFMGVGAYISVVLTKHFAFPFWAALICSGLGAGIIGLIFGLPALRIKGFYLLVSTLAAQFILMWCFTHIWPSVLGKFDGTSVPLASGGGEMFRTQQGSFYIIMICVVALTFFAKNIARTRVGRAFVAIRDNDLAAEVMGINLSFYKVLSFFICSVFAGIAGCLLAHYYRFVSPDYFTMNESIILLAIVIIGGSGSIAGSFFGVIFVRGLFEFTGWLSPILMAAFPGVGFVGSSFFPAIVMIFFGVILVLFLIFEPRGLAHRWERIKSSYRLWPFPY